MWECENEESDNEQTPMMKPKQQFLPTNENIVPFDNTTACFPNRKGNAKAKVDREKKLYKSLVDRTHPRQKGNKDANLQKAKYGNVFAPSGPIPVPIQTVQNVRVTKKK